MDEQNRLYTAAAAARMIGTAPGTVVHYSQRVLNLEHRAGRPYQLTEAQVEQLRGVIQTPRARQRKRASDHDGA